jgi:hypothetical protein
MCHLLDVLDYTLQVIAKITGKTTIACRASIRVRMHPD